MEIRLAALADYATTTDQGKLVIAGVFDVISAAGVPTTHPRVALAIRVHFLPEEGREHQLSVQYVDPDGKKLLDVGGPIQVPQTDTADGADAQFVINFEPLPIEAYGLHAFEIFIDGQAVGTVPLNISKMPAPPTPDVTIH